jgi:hypothetical protein
VSKTIKTFVNMDDSAKSEISSNTLNLPTARSASVSSASSLSPTLQINGMEFKLVEQLPNKRGKTSWIWKEGLKLLDVSDPAKAKTFWMCRHFRVARDEYDSYCKEETLPHAPPDLIRYWAGQAGKTPSLAQMALDLLSIPAYGGRM